MATVKNFGLAGVSSDVQFGKGGGRFIYDTDHFTVRDSGNAAFIETYGATPTGGSNANTLTTKEYVDSVATGLDFKDSAHVGTTANLAATYANVAVSPSGLGATLTSTGTGVLTAIDGEPLHLNDRILVKDQTNALENGIYTVTDLGEGGEYIEVQTVADVAGSLNNKYWEFVDGTDATTVAFYVWYNVNAAGVDPVGTGTGIEVAIATNATATTIAQATATAITSSAAAVTALHDSDDTLHILNDGNFNVTPNAADVDAGFTLTILVEGNATPTAWVLTRALDADNSPGNEVSGGMFIFLEHGASQSATGWVLSEPVGNASLGVDDLVFTQFSSAGIISVSGTAGEITVVQTGNDYAVSIDNTYLGQSSITTLGTITTGTWTGTTVAVANGGTGQTVLDDITNVAGARITVTDGTGTVIGGNVTLDVNEANLDLDAIGGSLGLTDQVTGILPVDNGGTGIGTITTKGIMYGNGTSAVLVTAAGSDGQVFRAGATGTPEFSTLTMPATIAAGSLFVANSANTLVAVTETGAAADQLLQWNDGGSNFEFVTTASVGGNKWSTINGDTGSAVAASVTDTMQMIGGAGITTVAATAATDTVTYSMDTTGLATVTLDAGVDLFFVDDGATGSVIGTVTAQNIVDAATINVFTTITGDTGSAAVNEETDALNFTGGEGIVTTASDVSNIADVDIALVLNEISAAVPIASDELVFVDGGVSGLNAKRSISSFLTDFAIVVDGDFATQGLMSSNGSGTYAMRDIVESTNAGEQGAQVNFGTATADIEIGIDITNLGAGTTMDATDEFIVFDGTNNTKMTGQNIIDGVLALGNDDRIVSPDTFTTAIVSDDGKFVVSTEDVATTGSNTFATFDTTVDAYAFNFTNAAGEITLEAGDAGGFGSGSTGDVDIRFTPGKNGEVIFGAAGTDATLTSSDGTTGENFVIIAGEGTAGAGGDITLTPGVGSTTDGQVCITDAESDKVMCFVGEATAVNAIQLTNGATGNAPTFSVIDADGTADTNIDIVILPNGTGVLSVAGTTTYEDNVTDDDDIPNRKFVVDADAAVLSGSISSFKFTVPLNANGDTVSGDTIPASATVMRVYINVGVADTAATLTVGIAGDEYAAVATNDPQTVGLYVVDLFSTTVGALKATVAATAATGGATADVIVEYKNA